MNLLSRMSAKFKKSAARAAMVLALVATIVVPVAATDTLGKEIKHNQEPQTPRFNYLKGDEEMLTAANYTKGQSDWVDPMAGSYAADIGDEVVFRFYFHNGTQPSTATNVIARTSLPNTIDTQHKVLSYLSSDQTPVITDTVVNDKIVGYGNGYSEINLTTPGRLEYIPGSTKIWRHNPEEWGTTIRDGITSNDGINIGSIQGCWPYSGFITFKVKVKSAASIAIDKYVGYPGTGQSWDTILEDTHEGETVAWKIPVKNIGDTEALKVLVKDTLPNKLSYISGTTVYFGPDAPENGYQMPDGLTDKGLYINSLMPGDANVAYFVFQTKIGTDLAYGSGGVSELVNTVTATYNNQSVQDQAKVTVVGESGITIQKKVWNGSSWVEQNNIKLGDNIRYQITVANVGKTTLNSIVVSDVMPVYTEYIASSTKLNSNLIADGITTTGVDIGNLARGCQAVIEFTVKTYGCPPVGDYTLVNTGYAKAANVSVISDTASTIMSLIKMSGPSISNL